MRWFRRRDGGEWDRRAEVSLELAKLVDLAAEYDLPMPVEPTRMVDGVIVHPAIGPGRRTR